MFPGDPVESVPKNALTRKRGVIPAKDRTILVMSGAEERRQYQMTRNDP